MYDMDNHERQNDEHRSTVRGKFNITPVLEYPYNEQLVVSEKYLEAIPKKRDRQKPQKKFRIVLSQRGGNKSRLL